MQKRWSPERYIGAFKLLQYGAALELIMIGLYRWRDISWLMYPIIVIFVCLVIAALLLAPRVFVAVFGAIGVGLICAMILIGLPVILLINSDSEPNPITISLLVAWIIITVIVLTLVYAKVEKYLLKRIEAKFGHHQKL